jgi:hypothetical protein
MSDAHGHYDLTEWKEAIRGMPRIFEYKFPLRPTLTVSLWFPDDMTEADAERVAAFVHSLAMTKDEKR